MADVYIDLDKLEQVTSHLTKIISDFENATSLSEELEAAIGDPFDRSELREKARDFEERWDDKRDQLTDGLKDIKDHVKGVFKAFKEWDTEAATAIGGGGDAW